VQDKHQLNEHNDNVVPKSHLELTKLQLPLYIRWQESGTSIPPPQCIVSTSTSTLNNDLDLAQEPRRIETELEIHTN